MFFKTGGWAFVIKWVKDIFVKPEDVVIAPDLEERLDEIKDETE